MKAGRRIKAYRAGLWAETFAALWLTVKGYRILARRCRTPFGEIDIVARRGAVVAFIEVKLRPSQDSGFAAVTPHAQNRIANAARFYVGRNADACAGRDLRFDVIAIAPPCWIRHMDNAWLSTGWNDAGYN